MKLPIFTFRLPYFLIATFLFVTEVVIAIYFKDDFIRPILGDFLVVILIYAFLMTFLKTSWRRLAIAVLLLAYTIEILQYINIMALLGVSHNTFTRMVLGTTFTWEDMVAYTLGISFVWWFEVLAERKSA